MASVETGTLPTPDEIEVQPAAPLLLLNRPRPVAAKRVWDALGARVTAFVLQCVSPVEASAQLDPPFVVFQTPLGVPA